MQAYTILALGRIYYMTELTFINALCLVAESAAVMVENNAHFQSMS